MCLTVAVRAAAELRLESLVEADLANLTSMHVGKEGVWAQCLYALHTHV